MPHGRPLFHFYLRHALLFDAFRARKVFTRAVCLSVRCRSFTIHIVDSDVHSASANGWLEDVSKVEKYKMSEEAYNARQDTYRRAPGCLPAQKRLQSAPVAHRRWTEAPFVTFSAASTRKYKEKMLAEDPSWTLEKEMAKRRNVRRSEAPQNKGTLHNSSHE